MEVVERNVLAGLALRAFGRSVYRAELTEQSVRFLARSLREVPVAELTRPVTVGRYLWFHALSFHLRDGTVLELAGLSASDAVRFASAVNAAWHRAVASHVAELTDERRALAKAVERLASARRYPAACLVQPFVDRAGTLLSQLPAALPDDALDASQKRELDIIAAFHQAPARRREAAINGFIEAQMVEAQRFFDEIESNPLTPEQRLAVLSDEDATLVLAGAGSGKTGVIVAKAAHLVQWGIRAPGEILLMAFGAKAAEEMAKRIKQRTGATIDALTFHALGYRIITEVEGQGPALALHASDESELRSLLREIIFDEAAGSSEIAGAILTWFSAFYWPYRSEWDFKSRDEYYQYVEAHELRTLQGEVVRSFEEWEIANWLFVNGIAYEYEPIYAHVLPKAKKRVYTPDFRLTESGVYFEHFGVRRARGPDGSVILTTAPNIDRDRYLEDMDWKRRLHAEHGTTLIETYSYEKVEGRLTQALAEKLAPYLVPKPIPPEQVFKKLKALGQVDPLTQTLATFLKHFKGGTVTLDACAQRARRSSEAPRCEAFLNIFGAVYRAYQTRLGDRIDFEDMIIRATQYVRSGRYRSPYRHLLVDEFQDISGGRAALLKALKGQHEDARIFAVGDDWQSIYRFSGADIHLMRNFGAEFGGKFAGVSGVYRSVDLGRTFRSVDRIALPARDFVLRNPAQIVKNVIPAGTTSEPAIAISYYDRSGEAQALRDALGRIEGHATGGVETARSSVLLLGRYRHVGPEDLRELQSAYRNLTLRFLTIHASKGLEADHVIILGANSDRLGFPSEIVDDPVLNLVLPEPEAFAHAEERRLFYVALTRARRSVTILADRTSPSVFVRELVNDRAYGVSLLYGAPAAEATRCGACGGRMLPEAGRSGRVQFCCEHRTLCGTKLPACPSCNADLPRREMAASGEATCGCGARFPACTDCATGWLVERKGNYGAFLGCVNYPACGGSRRLT